MLWPWSSIWNENFRQHAKRSNTLVPTPPVPDLLLSLLSSGNRSPVSPRNSCWICGTKVSSFYLDLKSDSKSKDGNLFQMCSFWKSENILPPPPPPHLLSHIGYFCFRAPIQPAIFISGGECRIPSPHTLESPLFFHLVGYPWKTISSKMQLHFSSIQNQDARYAKTALKNWVNRIVHFKKLYVGVELQKVARLSWNSAQTLCKA